MRKSLLVAPAVLGLAGCAAEPPVRKWELPLNASRGFALKEPPFADLPYQAPFRKPTHRAPTEASRRAAERQMRELIGLLAGRTTGPRTLRPLLDLPDGRFSGFVPVERGNIIANDAYIAPDEMMARTDLYAFPTFRNSAGQRIANPRQEIWYALGDGKLRKVHPNARRYDKRGERIRPLLPGQRGYDTASHKDVYDALEMEAPYPSDRWDPYPSFML